MEGELDLKLPIVILFPCKYCGVRFLPVICLLLLLILCRLIAAAASHSRAHHHSGNFGGRLYLRLVQRFAGHYLHFPASIYFHINMLI
jgi:hypothetical protein